MKIADAIPLSGLVDVDVDAVCQQDWIPRLSKGKRSNRLCRDAFITEWSGTDYRLVFVRNFTVVIKLNISKEKAKEIINRLGLKGKNCTPFRTAKSYRLDWSFIDN